MQAKTIEEIHAEAHAELGMMPATIIPALESLAALPRQTAAEVELFPSFKGGKQPVESENRFGRSPVSCALLNTELQ